MRVNLAFDESMPTAHRWLIHPYSDSAMFADVTLACYPLEEILAEKIRVLGGQRRFAIFRDPRNIH